MHVGQIALTWDEMGYIWRRDQVAAEAFFFVLLILSVLSSTWYIGHAQGQQFNVVDFGAVGDGKTDDSKAFLGAWNKLCGTSGNSMPTMLVPAKKTFLVKQVEFAGPCKSSSVQIQIIGNIVAPANTQWTDCKSECWFCFSNVESLTLTGTGTFEGNGPAWWKIPGVLRFTGCNNLQVTGLASHNSPLNHIAISSCKGVSLSNINLIAPADSPNTDGIDLSNSNQVTISDSFIGTGDDCVAINGGNSHVNMTRITCGPGHGISVGSLGKDGSMDTVEEVHIRNCTFNGTQNGARIKTWAGGQGFARFISYEDIILIGSQHPILIDQHYCPDQNCPPEKGTAVSVSDITFNGFRGTSADLIAITLNCSSVVPCKNIIMNEVNITPSIPTSKVVAICNNAQGTATSTTPAVPCLRSQGIRTVVEDKQTDGDRIIRSVTEGELKNEL
ncbi:hypothetical protein SLA2020_393380 [Shorea laevis]